MAAKAKMVGSAVAKRSTGTRSKKVGGTVWVKTGPKTGRFTVRASKESRRVIDEAVEIYGSALRRLADK